MSLNRTAIEWCRNPDGTRGFSWNPIVGCSHGCSYCWARKQAKRAKNRCEKCYQFIPHEHAERLGDPYHRLIPSSIFVCSMGDIFDPLILCEPLVLSILNTIEFNDQHRFFILTKNIQRVAEYDFIFFPENLWLGISIDGLGKCQVTGRPWPACRDLDALKRTLGAPNRFISFEPLLQPVDLDLEYIDWIIIGGQTGEKFYPPKKWVMPIVEQAKYHNIPVFMKPNLGPEYAGQLIQEFPEELWQK